MLVVHHRRYIAGKEPWDYPDGSLVTLCEECHEIERELWQECEGALIETLKEKFFSTDLCSLASGFHAIESKYPSGTFSEIMEWALSNEDLIEKVSALYFEDMKMRKEKADVPTT